MVQINKKKPVVPVLFTIFGAKGDLTRRKLIPALYNLFIGGHLPEIFSIYCIDYLTSDEISFKHDLLEGINEFSRNGIAEETKWKEFSSKIIYLQGDFQKDEIFGILKEKAHAH